MLKQYTDYITTKKQQANNYRAVITANNRQYQTPH